MSGPTDAPAGPCPFCGSADTLAREGNVAYANRFWVECRNDDCAALGPCAPTVELAIEAWRKPYDRKQ